MAWRLCPGNRTGKKSLLPLIVLNVIRAVTIILLFNNSAWEQTAVAQRSLVLSASPLRVVVARRLLVRMSGFAVDERP